MQTFKWFYAELMCGGRVNEIKREKFTNDWKYAKCKRFLLKGVCGWSSPLEPSANFCFALLLFVLYMCCEQIKQLRGAEMNSSIISSNTYIFSCIYDCFLPMTVYFLAQ